MPPCCLESELYQSSVNRAKQTKQTKQTNKTKQTKKTNKTKKRKNSPRAMPAWNEHWTTRVSGGGFF
jgi:hypothetical protein